MSYYKNAQFLAQKNNLMPIRIGNFDWKFHSNILITLESIFDTTLNYKPDI